MTKLFTSSVLFIIFCIAIGCNQFNQQNEIAKAALNIKFSIDSTAGKVTTLSPLLDAGTGGMAVDKDHNIIVADFGANLDDMGGKGNQLFKISPSGETAVWLTGFNGASGNCYDSQGNLFQSNIIGNFITKISPEGNTSIFTEDGLASPVGIQVDNNDDLYVCNCGNNSIQKISKDGNSQIFVKSKLLNCPNGITIDRLGSLYVSNFYDGAVIKILRDGTASLLTVIPGGNNGHLIYRDNYLYVVARSAHQIYKVSLDGTLSLFAGSGEKGNKNGAALQASFCYPNDITISSDHSTFYINEVADTTSKGTRLFPSLVRKILVN